MMMADDDDDIEDDDLEGEAEVNLLKFLTSFTIAAHLRPALS